MAFAPGVLEGFLITAFVLASITSGLFAGIAYNYGEAAIDNQAHTNNALLITTIIFVFLTSLFVSLTGYAIYHIKTE